MALKIDALKEANDKIKEGGEKTPLFVRQKDLTEATPFRLSPSLPSMNGMPYLRVVQWWFENKKAVISLETFGKACPIQEEIDEAVNGQDADTAALAGNENRIKKSESYWFPGWLLKYKMDGNDVVGIGVVDKGPKILQAGPQLTGHINDILISRIALKIKSEDNIADRELGYNIMLTKRKTGSGTRDVEYKAALDEQWEVPVKYFQDAIDPYEVAKAMCPNKSYQRALIRELLYGEEIPSEVVKKEEDRKEQVKEAFKEKQHEKEAAAGPKKPSKVSTDEDAEDDEEKPKKSAPAKSSKKPPVDDDEDDENDLPFDKDDDEEDKPKVTKKSATKTATKKAAPVDEDDEEEKPKKEVAKKKPMNADLDDDEFED